MISEFLESTNFVLDNTKNKYVVSLLNDTALMLGPSETRWKGGRYNKPISNGGGGNYAQHYHYYWHLGFSDLPTALDAMKQAGKPSKAYVGSSKPKLFTVFWVILYQLPGQ